MRINKDELIKHIRNYGETGMIHDSLIPFYDQDGKWCGSPISWHLAKSIPHLDRIKSSYLPSSRRTCRDRSGTVLRTSFIWRGDENVRMSYAAIRGSLIVEGNAIVHAACLRHVSGRLVSSTNRRVNLPNLQMVGWHYEIMETFDVKVPRLRHVGGRAQMLGHFPPRLETVGQSLGVYWCFTAESSSLRQVGDYLVLTKAEAIRLPVLETIGGGFLLTLLVKSIDVPKLKSIGGDFFAPCAQLIRARALRSVGGNMDTSSAKGFYHPRITAGGAWTTYPGDVEEWTRNEAARKAMKQKDIWL